MPNPIIDVARQQRQQLDQRQTDLVNRLGSAYATAIRGLENEINGLQADLINIDNISSSKLFRLARYTSLQAQIVEQLQRYGSFADLQVMSEVPKLITLAGNDSFILVRDQFRSQAGRNSIANTWDRLNVEQIEQALTFLTRDSPFHTNLTTALGEGVANRIEDALIQSVIVGKNPRVTAQVIRRELGLGLAWSLNSARTAQIWTYRTATHSNYLANSNIVSGWTWLSALDRRTCASCISKHGQVFSVDQVLNDHHQGRCTAIPNVRNAEKFGIEPTVPEKGEQWFNQQPESIQSDILGPGRLEAYRNNEFQFQELSRPYENNIYGTMLREATLRELTER